MNICKRPVSQRRERLENTYYTKYVKSLPSCVSGIQADDPHHIKGYAEITGASGGKKGDDLFVIPLTRAEHTELHNIGEDAWEKKYGSQAVFCLKTIRQAILDGVIRW